MSNDIIEQLRTENVQLRAALDTAFTLIRTMGAYLSTMVDILNASQNSAANLRDRLSKFDTDIREALDDRGPIQPVHDGSDESEQIHAEYQRRVSNNSDNSGSSGQTLPSAGRLGKSEESPESLEGELQSNKSQNGGDIQEQHDRVGSDDDDHRDGVPNCS